LDFLQHRVEVAGRCGREGSCQIEETRTSGGIKRGADGGSSSWDHPRKQSGNAEARVRGAAAVGQDARRLEGGAVDGTAVITGDLDVQLLAEASEVADGIEQVAFGLRQRLQGDGLAAAPQQGLDDV